MGEISHSLVLIKEILHRQNRVNAGPAGDIVNSPLPAVIARGQAGFPAEELREMAGIGVAQVWKLGDYAVFLPNTSLVLPRR
jgi:hypothetical protein